jgi:hypothetical protein
MHLRMPQTVTELYYLLAWLVTTARVARLAVLIPPQKTRWSPSSYRFQFHLKDLESSLCNSRDWVGKKAFLTSDGIPFFIQPFSRPGLWGMCSGIESGHRIHTVRIKNSPGISGLDLPDSTLLGVKT